jgi:hypothetical protein
VQVQPIVDPSFRRVTVRVHGAASAPGTLLLEITGDVTVDTVRRQVELTDALSNTIVEYACRQGRTTVERSAMYRRILHERQHIVLTTALEGPVCVGH